MQLLSLLFALILCLSAPGQLTLVPNNGGDGSDGIFAPTSNMTLDSATKPVWQFSSMSIPAGITVNCIGPNPIVIKVQATATIEGTLSARGATGGAGGNNLPGGVGGVAGAGGGNGGNGACDVANPFSGTGQPGVGPSPGQPGSDTSPPAGGAFADPVGGGGGGGNTTAGTAGGPPNSASPLPSGSGVGGPALPMCRPGSGGGGGGGDIDSTTLATSNDGGSGGGGGGGWLTLAANTGIIVGVNGIISVDGGNGGASPGNGGGGGGGSGGTLHLLAPLLSNDGMITAMGGSAGAASQTNCGCSPGGAGGFGCIGVSSSTILGTGSIVPTVIAFNWSSYANAVAPVARFTVNAPGATDVYYVLAAIGPSLSPIPTPFGPFVLDLSDPLFTALFPINTLPSIFSGMTGVGNGDVVVDLGPLNLPVGTEAIVLFQAVSANANGLTGVSPFRPLFLKT